MKFVDLLSKFSYITSRQVNAVLTVDRSALYNGKGPSFVPRIKNGKALENSFKRLSGKENSGLVKEDPYKIKSNNLLEHIEDSSVKYKPENYNLEAIQKAATERFVLFSKVFPQGTKIVFLSPTDKQKNGPDALIVLPGNIRVGIQFKFRQKPFDDDTEIKDFLDPFVADYSSGMLLIIGLNNPNDLVKLKNFIDKSENKHFLNKVIFQDGSKQIGINLGDNYVFERISIGHPEHQQHVDQLEYHKNNSLEELIIKNYFETQGYIMSGRKLEGCDTKPFRDMFNLFREHSSIFGDSSTFKKSGIPKFPTVQM